MLELKNVTKKYGKHKTVFTALDNVSLQIQDGESVAIVGKSGSGKSTLMHIMSGLDRASEGEVIVDEQSLATMKQKQLDKFRAQKIGFIFQSFFVQANETSIQNVALPLEIANTPASVRQKRIATALRVVGLDDKMKQKAGNLSGGQKQRLAVARAIVSNPKIIFADEPTGNLDSVTGEKIENLLFGLNKRAGSTLIVVTHDKELAGRCDRQITIKDGKIIADSHLRQTKKSQPKPVAKGVQR